MHKVNLEHSVVPKTKKTAKGLINRSQWPMLRGFQHGQIWDNLRMQKKHEANSF